MVEDVESGSRMPQFQGRDVLILLSSFVGPRESEVSTVYGGETWLSGLISGPLG
jgi:hypothetical protein